MKFGKQAPAPVPVAPKYPGIPAAIDGSTAVVEVETAASEAAGAYPITPSTQMGEGWAAAVAAGKLNVSGRPLIFFEPEGEHAAAGVTAGLSMTGLRATNFSSGQGIAYMHESLYAAVGKRLPYVLNVACRAITKHALNVHAGHDDYHAVDDTGFFQLFAKNVQEGADLPLIARRIAELSLTPGLCGQDGFLTSHVIESMRLPERALVREFLGDPGDIIDSPTPAQRLVYGDRRRRVPEAFDVDYPTMLGVVQNQDAYQQGVAAQRPFYFDHVAEIADQAFADYAALTGRAYARATGYRTEDAEYVIVGQGSVVTDAEALVDHLRATRQLRIGVVNVTMFRPFPADRLTALLRGKRGVVVLERVDQPLAVDPPLLREIRAAMGKAVENGRARGVVPYPGVAACAANEVPDFYSGCFGLGSRDLQPGDLLAAVENMLPGGAGQRQFYLSIDFIRKNTRLPKLQIWQERLLASYPHLATLALTPAAPLSLLPPGALAVRIHSVGGWGAITMGKNLTLIAGDLLGLSVKANPKYGSEKKGQPTTFYATLAPEPVRTNCELKDVHVVLSPDPNAVANSNPLAGLVEGGVFVVQTERSGAEFWAQLPASVQRTIRERKLRVFTLDGFRIAQEEVSDPELRYRTQAAAFLGAFFRVAPLPRQLDETLLFKEIRNVLAKKFGRFGDHVVEENVRVIRRGYAAVVEMDVAACAASGSDAGALPERPSRLVSGAPLQAPGNPGRFWEQVGFLYATGADGIADPFAALGALPAVTGLMRDMTSVRIEVPEFIPARCTGCSQCWVQCPDSAIPGLVTPVEDVLNTAAQLVSAERPVERLKQIVKHLGGETRRLMRETPFTTFADVLAAAYANVADKLGYDAGRRAELDGQFAAVHAALVDFPLAKTAPFFDRPEAAAKGTGGLLSITINPETCKGCNICVEVCPDGALRTVRQTDDVVDRLRRQWRLWEMLPETDDRYIQIASLDEGIGVLSSMLLKKSTYLSMVGGDGACMGCGEKTAIHLVLSAVHASVLPRVKTFVDKLDRLIADLDTKARGILASDADLERVAGAAAGTVGVPLDEGKRAQVAHITGTLKSLRDLRWRYTEGPAGRGRAACGIINATGCSSVWGSTYPFNPYPVPWANHLFQDAPSVAIGVFEGQMRKMADGFAAVRRAELELAGEYDPAVHDDALRKLDWRVFTDDELALCPPIFAVGGDGAMLDIGFQNLSRLLASGKPVRVIVLDTQVYSNTGGQACTSGFTAQVSDMAEYGPAQRGKEETRKELGLLAIAHRNAFVLQSSQATPSHLIAGVLRGLRSRYPAVFMLNTPCPPEHGLADYAAPRAARLAVESRAFPVFVYDPAAGSRLAERLSLDGNPAVDDVWPTYELRHVDETGAEQVLELPVTIGDWAATEARFRKHFTPVAKDADEATLVPFHEYLPLAADDREGKTPFVYSLGRERRLGRLVASEEIVRLAEDRHHVWALLRDMAAVKQPELLELEAEFARKEAALRGEYEAKLADIRSRYPQMIARRLAERLLAEPNGKLTDMLGGAALLTAPPAAPGTVAFSPPAPPAAPVAAAPAAVAPAPTTASATATVGDALAMEPYIDSALCTACNECTNLNKRLFAYNDKKQAYIKDSRAGTFKQLVQAAEKCPVKIIHPGTPLDPKEKDLAKWIERAKPFN